MARMSWVCLFLGVLFTGCASERQSMRTIKMHSLPRCNDQRSVAGGLNLDSQASQKVLIEALVHTVVQSALNVAIEKQDRELSENERTLVHSSSALATEILLRKMRQ